MSWPRHIISVFACMLGLGLNAQNLVPNGGFESYSSPPAHMAHWWVCTGWSSVNNSTAWPVPPPYPASPDYFHILGTDPLVIPPNVGPGTVVPHTGDALMGLAQTYATSLPDFREYLSTPLTAPLAVGSNYTLSFWITNGSVPSCGYSTTGFAACLSIGTLTQADHEPISATPQFVLTVPFWNTNWQQITYVFTATAPYDHVTFGNYTDDASIVIVDTLPSVLDCSYLFLDDVSLTGSTVTIDAGFTVEQEVLCDTVLVNFTDTTGGPITSWQWSFPGALPPNSSLQYPQDIAYTTSGTYPITLIACAALDCDTAYGSITVSVPVAPIFDLGPDTALCLGSVVALSTGLPAATHEWSSGATTSDLLVGPGTWWVSVEENGCVSSDTITITEHALPSVIEPPPLCPGENIVIAVPAGSHDVQWTHGPGTPSILVNEPGTYSFTATSLEGCPYADSMLVVFVDDTGILFAPNAFTPNGDGINDVFAVVGAAEEIGLLIHDRWGEEVFSSDLPIWDGTYHGAEPKEDIYIYTLSYHAQCGTGRTKVTGHITLLR